MKNLLFLLLSIFIFSISLNASNISDLIADFEKVDTVLDENLSQEEKINRVIESKNIILNKLIYTIKTEKKAIVLDENDTKVLDERLDFLSQRISINSTKGNKIAVERDNLEILSVNMDLNFEKFINSIIKGRSIYLSKKELKNIATNFIQTIESDDIKSYEKLYEDYKNITGNVVRDFNVNFEKYTQKQKIYLYIANYLKNNVDKFNKENLLISILNLDYFSKFIDNTELGKSLNAYSEHYLSVKVGRLTIAVFIVFLILSFRNYFIPFIIAIFEKLAQNKGESNLILHRYLVDSLSTPVKVGLVIFAVEIALRVVSIENVKLDDFISKFQTLYIISIAWIIYNLLNNAIVFFSENITVKYPNVRREMVNFFVTIFKGILFILIILLILRDFGYDVTTILASLGVGGIAIALAAQSTLSNFFGSLTIILDNSFSQGDWIETSDVEGTVVELGLRSTTIRTFDNALVTTPNSSLANASIKNWSRRSVGRRVKMKIGVTYESNKDDFLKAIDDIEKYLIDSPKIADVSTVVNKNIGRKLIKKEDLLGVKNSISVAFEEYGDFSINILINCFTKTTDWQEFLKARQEVLVAIWDIIENNNLEFAYPTQKLFLENQKD